MINVSPDSDGHEKKIQKYFFISKSQCSKSFPSVVAPKSLHLADPCLPPCHPVQRAGWGPGASAYNPPACTKHLPRLEARLLLPWGQRSNRGTELQKHASTGVEQFQNERMKLSCYHTSVCLSHVAGFIWMYFWGTGGSDQKMRSAL